jgi:hypothetical protein
MNVTDEYHEKALLGGRCHPNSLPKSPFGRSTFRREGYLFDAGIKTIENARIMRLTLAQLGLLDRLDLLRSPIALITETDVRPIRSPEDITAHFSSAMNWFPDQREGLSRVLRDVQCIATALGAPVRP